MPRSVVGLLAALGAAMSALVGLTHGDLISVMIVGTGAATGLAAYLPLALQKKISSNFRYCSISEVRSED
jgi:uncharacterized membrane protein YuzA (DUF378 family)